MSLAIGALMVGWMKRWKGGILGRVENRSNKICLSTTYDSF